MFVLRANRLCRICGDVHSVRSTPLTTILTAYCERPLKAIGQYVCEPEEFMEINGLGGL